VILIPASSVTHSAVLSVPSEYSNIQSAVNSATDGDTVLISNGTYQGNGNRDIDLMGKAVQVVSVSGFLNCVIDCEGSATQYHRGFVLQSGETNLTEIEGVTIMNGYHIAGAGIYCLESSPIIKNCIIRDCTAVGDTNSGGSGGGILFSGGNENAHPILENCKIDSNSALENNNLHAHGGGILIQNYTSTDLYPEITGCIISANISTYYGAGIALVNCKMKMVNCQISGNAEPLFGGGISCEDSDI
jgi:hypothetical protein